MAKKAKAASSSEEKEAIEITEDTVYHVAKTARLDLTEKEAKKFTNELKEIVSAFSKLDELDTDNVKASFHPIEIKNVLREDKTEKCFTQEEVLSLTEHKKDGYFKGPKVV